MNKCHIFYFVRLSDLCSYIVITYSSFPHHHPQIVPPGRAAWVREEALASILSVVMLELPVSKTQAQLFQDQNGEKKDTNVASAFVNRISLQVLVTGIFVAGNTTCKSNFA